ncbi:amino acid ABC transporter substrate-binding protein [Streptomyces sp. HNM0645]|uniref:amino acid ABC transporter substrate-binding protein n=1 Tax=Streptomyces sp. HNM0645 TaxID=2782343 RepID=UPI0024B80875|nr:amino acid ABC transporter substrate-binding protein [Streptomyces sp. HNM0645]MDI9888366.1 amino acid ABC transporter substrate-binding protein [Streptomyces sp. HNM0645]
MHRPVSTRVATLGAAALIVVASGCAGPKTGSSESDGTNTIVIGASLPLSGPLAGFGGSQKWGYEHALKEVNAAGGIDIDGSRRKVELKILDDKSDPNQVSQNTQTLISSNKVSALLGSCTPALVTAGAVVAERAKVPFVTGCSPLQAFTSVKEWTYAWDIFFDESDVGALPFDTLKSQKISTNKKVAILHDNGPDGTVVGGQIWPSLAKQHGYKVVANVEFPTDNTDFSAAVQQAKGSGADILLVSAVTPQAVSIRKQMATAGYEPKFIQMEKGAEPLQFAQALGSLADGVTVGAYWDPSFPYKGAKDLAAAYEKESGGSQSQHIADSYTVAKVLLDAVARAGSTENDAVNDAIRWTSGTYPVGPVLFSSDNTAKLPMVEVQWQNGKTVVVWPSDATTGKFLSPAS